MIQKILVTFAAASILLMPNHSSALNLNFESSLSQNTYIKSGDVIDGQFNISSILNNYNIISGSVTFLFDDDSDAHSYSNMFTSYELVSTTYAGTSAGKIYYNSTYTRTSMNWESDPTEFAVLTFGGNKYNVTTPKSNSAVVDDTLYLDYSQLVTSNFRTYYSERYYTKYTYSYQDTVGPMPVFDILNTTSLQTLINSGMLSFNVTGFSGDMFLKSTSLQLEVDPKLEASAVPEPSTLALSGAGLLCIVFLRRLKPKAR